MSNPIRIAFLSEHASPVALLGSEDAGGQNVYVDEVSRNLASQGYLVDVFTRRDSATAPEIVEWAPGVRVINLTAGPAEFLLKDQLWPLMPAFRDAFLDFMARQELRYDLIHGNFWMSGWVAAELKQRLGIPAVHIFHAMGKTKQRHQGAADTSPDGRIQVELEVINRVDRLIAQCPSEESELVDDYGADLRKVVVIPSSVNVERFRPLPRDEARRIVGLETDELVVAYIGRMLPRKDPRNIVRALGILAQRTSLPVRLMLVGGETADPAVDPTPELARLREVADECGVAHLVHFTGKRQPDVLHQYYSAADVVVTTPWYEPFGLTPLEAMACGRPVIGSAVGGITFTIADGVTGFLVPPQDPAALADKLELILSQPELRERMGQAARRRVEQEFTWAATARRTAELYQSLLPPAEDALLEIAVGAAAPTLSRSSSRARRQA